MANERVKSSYETKRKVRNRSQLMYDPHRGIPITDFIKASTFWQIWPSVCFCLIWSGVITLLNRPAKTSSAYAQYNDARKSWGSVIHQSRSLSRMIWHHVPNELKSHSEKEPISDKERVQAILEKKTMINLIEAFAVSLKHHLRGEYGIYYDDLYHLVCMLPKYQAEIDKRISQDSLIMKEKLDSANDFGKVESFVVDLEADNLSKNNLRRTSGSSSKKNGPVFPSKSNLLPGYNPPKMSLCDFFPILRVVRSLFKGTMNVTRIRKAAYHSTIPDDHIPMDILWYLTCYVVNLQKRKIIDVPTTNVINASLVGLSDALTNLERVLTTPIPLGYLVHLNTIIWGYLLFLPFQLIGTFKKITVPATGLIAFAFIGFLKIGEDIENPFGYEKNDFDLDHFCMNIIGRELDELTSTPPSDPMDYLMNSNNIPLFSRGCFDSAAEMSNNLLPTDIQNLLAEKS
ncbi:Bestrophin, RFP-TM, chloride channel-domain-containing protein [Phakopsora pachyrhizi]|uniref:Bestrophin, RFP-TM, chloride channel-domain-containing protein n=1 Tax=Phakopsora pachyrhizi TaxID=170000 RepID=A0AAV0AJ68_PHAPC|nr:Bestrophin, RFP-TM, chloride channel-domain-containing protein [Phakopsora pachyrhizi]CAH7667566.1 Bestrophin, RFP-TM, chloride channel-domain-containing protein [Phakopsora pachyrhizi]